MEAKLKEQIDDLRAVLDIVLKEMQRRDHYGQLLQTLADSRAAEIAKLKEEDPTDDDGRIEFAMNDTVNLYDKMVSNSEKIAALYTKAQELIGILNMICSLNNLKEGDLDGNV